MKIVASCDIGDLGPREGIEIGYYWNPIYNVLGLIPWLLLLGAVTLFKENRCGQAMWILLPVVIFRLLWAAFAALMGFPSEASSMFISLIDCLSVGFVLIWLLAERIGNRNRFVTWILALLLFALSFGVMPINLGMGIEAIQLSIFIVLTVGIIMLSFPLAGFMCRKKFGPVRFSLWMAMWIFALTMGIFLVIGSIQLAMMGGREFAELAVFVVGVILMGGGLLACVLIVAILPFEIILFVNRFWRKRFEAVFGLKSASVAMIEPVGIDRACPWHVSSFVV